jgi:hypothetical protein
MKRSVAIGVCVVGGFCLSMTARAAELADEFKVKREAVFEFAQKPAVTREGDKVTISFATQGLCDVTVAIEDRNGKILRHLASGVLGENAPPPLLKGSHKQVLIWDSKNDKGEYVDDRANTVIRVSLGLQARFERHFLWSPYRRFNSNPPSFCAQPEGVCVFDGKLTGFIYLFDHSGNYARTVYPFPADKLDKVVGLRERVFEQSGKTLPWKSGMLYSSLLTCGGNTRFATSEAQIHDGAVNSAMTIRNGQIALAFFSLNSLAIDGTSGGLPLEGPETRAQGLFPRSVALSPDGKTAYVTGFHRLGGIGAACWTEWVHGVGRVDVGGGKRKKSDRLATFAGTLSLGKQAGGSAPGQFKVPSSVDCDPRGRVYVTDHFNDRIQVFSPDGKHLKDIAVAKPAEVGIDPRNGEIYVFSWALDSKYFRKGGGDGYGKGSKVSPKLTHLAPFESLKMLGEYSFPITDATLAGGRHGGTQYRATVNYWAPGDVGPEIWLISGAHPRYGRGDYNYGPLQILRKKKGENVLEVVKDFIRQAKQEVPVLKSFYRDQICVNPTTGELWIPGSALVVQPETGQIRSVKFPQPIRELAFDANGHAFFSTGVTVSRFALSADDKWREVPFDYGEAIAGRLAALPTGGGPFHSGGISVSARGDVLVAVQQGGVKEPNPEKEKERLQTEGKPWQPLLYPGRGGRLIVRVWDRHGKMLYDDAVQGIGYCHNVFMDQDHNIYVASGAFRKGYRDANTGTLVKLRPQSKILTTSSVLPLKNQKPDRPPDTQLGGIGSDGWWEGVEWFYGGIGANGKNHGGIHACHCAQFRVDHDYFDRSFVPETVHYTVGVLDRAGNLIMRIGQYGNIDEGLPLVPDPRIPQPRPLGGDEVAFFHPAYLAVDTDRRLFVNDPGNDRIVSVKLGYHANERVALADVPDGPAAQR